MIRFVWVNLVIALATVACGLAAIAAAIFRVRGRFYASTTQAWARAAIWASGTPVTPVGMERVRWAEPSVLVSNHVSYWDIFAIASVLPEAFHFVGKKELNRIPFFGLAWRAAGHISIDRTNRASAVASLRKAGEKIRREKGTVIMFPEGTRSRAGGLRPFKKGAFLLAAEAGVPIVPVVVRGSERVAPGGMRLVPTPIEVVFGEPIPTTGAGSDRPDELSDRVRARMLEMLAEPARILAMALLLPLLGACGSDAATISGTLDSDLDVDRVWVLGGGAPAEVEAGRFLLEEISGDTVDLRFAEGDEERGRMRIYGVRPGARIELDGVWAEDERFHPTAVRLDGVDRVEINGLRYAEPAEEIDEAAVVLAVSTGGDALLLRPDDASHPDLRVVVTPGTRVISQDGDPLDADGAERGDSVRVRATRQGSYLVATELTLPRESARREESAPQPARPLLGVPVEESREKEKRGRGRGKGKG